VGINSETAAFLCEARAGGTSFRRVLTLGRQNLSTGADVLLELAARHGIEPGRALAAIDPYAEKFFRVFLGAEEVHAIDHSGYEGAALVHDLNTSIPRAWEQRYDAVIDGGTLEHIFNFPAAIANCMRMLRIGGELFVFAPANNQLGHGFYQFSPELFYRTLAPEHGFTVRRMVAVPFRYPGTEHGSLGRHYEVTDPAAVGERITLVNSRPVTLMVQARKAEHRVDPFRTFPQQSDYELQWKEGAGAGAHARAPGTLRKPIALVKRLLPPALLERARNEYDRYFVHSFRNRRFYSRVKD
jgi:hypothetical protein